MKRDCRRRRRHRRKICAYERVLQLQRKEVWVKWKIWAKIREPSNTRHTWHIFLGLINAPARVHFTLFYSDGHVIKTRLRSCDVRYFRWHFVNFCLHNIVYDVTYRHYYNNNILYNVHIDTTTHYTMTYVYWIIHLLYYYITIATIILLLLLILFHAIDKIIYLCTYIIIHYTLLF